jgi:hypothetical protein
VVTVLERIAASLHTLQGRIQKLGAKMTEVVDTMDRGAAFAEWRAGYRYDHDTNSWVPLKRKAMAEDSEGSRKKARQEKEEAVVVAAVAPVEAPAEVVVEGEPMETLE